MSEMPSSGGAEIATSLEISPIVVLPVVVFVVGALPNKPDMMK